MTLNKKYIVLPTYTFKEELKNITSYFKYRLKEPLLTKRFYKNVSNKIKSLEFMPEKHMRISDFKNKNRNLRKLLIDNYTIIYEVINDTRTSFHFTYIS